MPIEQPQDVNPFYPKARAFVAELKKKLPCLSDAILDDWGGGVRIIYNGSYMEDCTGNCQLCQLAQLVGFDAVPGKFVGLRTTLCLPNAEQAALMVTGCRYLNNKTPEQYMKCFVQYCLHYCESEEKLLAELDWVRGFRLLLFKGIDDEAVLNGLEREMKTQILNSVFARHPSQKMRDLVHRYAQDNASLGVTIHYHYYDKLTPATRSLLLYPGASDKHPVVSLVVRGHENKPGIFVKRVSHGNYAVSIPELSEDFMQKALALVVGYACKNPCEQAEIELHAHESPGDKPVHN